MNKIIESIQDHRSIRNFKSDDIDDKALEAIVKSAQAMPNSINGQQTSIILIKDQETRKKIAEIAGGQVWIEQAPVFMLFVADFYKTNLAAEKNGLEQKIHESVESTLVGAVDVGLNMGAAILAAESLGLGIVPIGGIRKDPKAMIELLDMPEFTYPVAGLAIGHPVDKSKKKPRMPLGTFLHKEKYHKEGLKEAMDAYDEKMEKYLVEVGREKEGNWSKQTSNVYQYVYFPNVHPTMKEQGFTNDK